MNTLFLILIFIICGLGGYCFVVEDAMQEATESRVESDMDNIKEALDHFKNDVGFYPDTANGLLALTGKENINPIPEGYSDTGYMLAVPEDIWGFQYQYQYFGVKGNGIIVLKSLGADSKIGGYKKNKDIIKIYEDT